MAHFHADPVRGKLMPGTKHSINISFNPKNFGKFSQTMNLNILNGIYNIPLTMQGSSNSMGAKEVRDPSSSPPRRNASEAQRRRLRTSSRSATT